MASDAISSSKETYNEIKTILISQPKPERSPYFDIAKKWNIQIDWRPFIHVEAVTEKEFASKCLNKQSISVYLKR